MRTNRNTLWACVLIALCTYVAAPGTHMELLGERLMEYTTNLHAHELRDPNLRYVAYVPKGSIERGKRIPRTGANGLTLAPTARSWRRSWRGSRQAI